MPRNICCNPYGVHKSQVTKLLRQVTDVTASVSSLVSEGDFICDYCRKRLTARPKVEPPNPEPPNPEVSTDESFIGDSADESAEESTADEFSTEVDEEIAQPILNEFLPSLGQSPVKRSK